MSAMAILRQLPARSVVEGSAASRRATSELRPTIRDRPTVPDLHFLWYRNCSVPVGAKSSPKTTLIWSKGARSGRQGRIGCNLMKGTIVKCLEELVTEKFGVEKWTESLKKAGIPEWRNFTTFCDVDETEVMGIMKGIAGVASLSMEQLMEAFGEYWSTVYGPNIYEVYFADAKCARELLLNLDHIHEVMTKSIKFARPPRFRYEWKGDKLLIMHYESSRGLVALMPGLVRGVGKYYKENLIVTVVGRAVHVQFP